MNRKLRRAQYKAEKKNAAARNFSSSGIEHDYSVAIDHHRNGRLAEAETAYRQVLAKDANIPAALFNLGSIIQHFGHFDEAIELSRRTITLQPDHAGAYNNLGAALQKLGRLDEASDALGKALSLTPNDALSHNNMANILLEKERPEEAISFFERAIELNPNFASAHYNLGVALKKLDRLEDAASSFQKAIDLHPEFAEGYYNLGKIYQELGRLDEALNCYHQAINKKTDYGDAWKNLKVTTKSFLFSNNGLDRKEIDIEKALSPSARSGINFAFYEYFLDNYKPHQAIASYNAVMKSFPEKINRAVERPQLFKQIVSLLHFGRSGTGLMHSLIDNHPEISTLPSIFLSGYFNEGVWEELTAEGLEKLPERFTDKFEVLFDATSPKPVPGPQDKIDSYLGIKEGMASVGESRNEVLRVDRQMFCNEAWRLMNGCDTIDAGEFLQVIHAAYEKAIGTTTEKKTIFFHIHNPNEYAKFNFLHHLPDARLMMMVRNPVQSCESWVREPARDHDCHMIYQRISIMLYDIDRIIYRLQDSVGVRLEDLKLQPEATMQALSRWIGIDETPSLYEMTAQGKKWWGDPSSLDYNNKKEMAPFDDTCVYRPSGSVFGERDMFLLKTLFHPFSVRFGYEEEDLKSFRRALKESRIIIDNMLDFENVIIQHRGIDPELFRRSGEFLMFRAALSDRLDVLDKFCTYPYMLPPLKIGKVE